MANMKRWSVTYTKQTKQKRKVYQDGFLELDISTNKIILYDDCERLLECRIAKKDEVVSSGETLTFNAYLVDVGDPEGGHKPLSDLNSQGSDKKITEKPGLLKRQKFRNHSVSFEDRKNDVEKNKARPTLSPSHKIIRDFKKSELHKYKAPQSSPDTTKPSIAEWQVLYTTQVTQKAKKYHDGFLRLSACGSLGRQVMLFDASKKLLNSRFLKKDEVIRSGESIAFDAHLVEIGEPDGELKPFTDLNVQRDNCNGAKETGTMHRQENCVDLSKHVEKEFEKSKLDKHGAPESSPDKAKPTLGEWQVLYTTQLTQKAKKYHDGFLRLAICGSQGRQVLLYDASRKLLGSRFLKKYEVIKSGESIALDGHLIEIGELEGNSEPLMDLNIQVNDGNIIKKSGLMHGQQLCPTDKKSVVKGIEERHIVFTFELLDVPSNYIVTLLNEDKTILSRKFLSLSEDVRTGTLLELPKYLVEVGEPCVSPEGAPQNNPCLEKDVVSKFSISSVDEIKLSGRVPPNKPIRDAHQILSSLQKPMAQESNVADYMDNSTMELGSSIKEPQVSDTFLLDFPEDIQPPRASLQHHESSENVGIWESSENIDIGNSPDLISCEAISSCNGSESSKEVDLDNSHQPCLDKVEAGTQRCDGAFPFGKSISTPCASYDPVDNAKKTSKEHTCTREMEERPSFDLGF